MRCVKCGKNFKDSNYGSLLCKVCYALENGNKILNFEERNKLHSMKGSSQDKMIEARLYRMWILASLYTEYKNGEKESLVLYNKIHDIIEANYWIRYYNSWGGKR